MLLKARLFDAFTASVSFVPLSVPPPVHPETVNVCPLPASARLTLVMPVPLKVSLEPTLVAVTLVFVRVNPVANDSTTESPVPVPLKVLEPSPPVRATPLRASGVQAVVKGAADDRGDSRDGSDDSRGRAARSAGQIDARAGAETGVAEHRGTGAHDVTGERRRSGEEKRIRAGRSGPEVAAGSTGTRAVDVEGVGRPSRVDLAGGDAAEADRGAAVHVGSGELDRVVRDVENVAGKAGTDSPLMVRMPPLPVNSIEPPAATAPAVFPPSATTRLGPAVLGVTVQESPSTVLKPSESGLASVRLAASPSHGLSLTAPDAGGEPELLGPPALPHQSEVATAAGAVETVGS